MPSGQSEADREAEAEKAFRASLEPEDAERFRAVEAFFLSPRMREDCLPTEFIRRIVVEEFLRLDYTPQHLAFDDSPRVTRRWRVGEQSQERLGKKLQWIAWHRAVAAVNWTHSPRNEFWDDDPVRQLRDFDPTLRLDAPLAVEALRREWATIQADFDAEPDAFRWANTGAGLPRLEDMLGPKLGGREWVMVHGSPAWTSDEDVKGDRRQAFWKIDGFLVRQADFAAWDTWAANRDFYNSDLPEELSSTYAFLGEMTSPWNDEELRLGWWPWATSGRRAAAPIELGVPVKRQSGERNPDWTHRSAIYMPSSLLMPTGLARDPSLTAWMSGEAAAMLDPLGADPCLLIRRDALEEHCTRNGLVLVWAILGERFAYGSGEGRRPDLPDRRWSGSGAWQDGPILKIAPVVRDGDSRE